MLNLAERRKKRCVKIEKKIRAAGSFCMNKSYFRFLFRLARKYKQSGLSKSEKSLVKRNATLKQFQIPVKKSTDAERGNNFGHHPTWGANGRPMLNGDIQRWSILWPWAFSSFLSCTQCGFHIQLFRERLSERCARDNPERWHCSCRTFFCCFP